VQNTVQFREQCLIFLFEFLIIIQVWFGCGLQDTASLLNVC